MNKETTMEAATLYSAMAAAFAKIGVAVKDAKNPHFKSTYADLASVVQAIKPALIEHDLFFTQPVTNDERGVTVETILYHANGESLSFGKLTIPVDANKAQAMGSAITYGKRYSLQAAFGVPSDDDDGNAAQAAPPPAKQAAPITDDQRDMIVTLAEGAGKSLKDICDAYKIGSLKELSSQQAEAAIAKLQKMAPAKEPVDA
ncbi:ERF family protein [Sphingomicrobium sp. XHP0235]|uniref:ERF family protein n=1 Tax=Sphingomicrobium aquimarinum TaxID=3133971 RepID=UPI0031FE75BA